MEAVKKIDRTAIDAAIEAVMELVCDRCHYCYTEPTMEETLTGECSQCETCPIEAKIRETTSLVERQVAMGFAGVIADSLKDFFEGRGAHGHSSADSCTSADNTR